MDKCVCVSVDSVWLKTITSIPQRLNGYVIFKVVLVFSLPLKNLGIDTKIIKFELVTELWSFKGFCGHHGGHLEKNAFQEVQLR